MTTPIRFDDSLPAFAALVESAWGKSVLADNLFLRDASGRLTFVMLRDVPSPDERTSFAARAVAELGAYVDKDGFAIATPDELFDDRLKNIRSAIKFEVSHDLFKGSVRSEE